MNEEATELFSLSHVRAVVTGASRGIGLAIANVYAELGAEVVLVARGKVDEIAAEMADKGLKATGIQTDLGDGSARGRMWKRILEDGTPPNVLVNNAGVIRRADFTEYSMKDWNEVVETNLTAAFHLSQMFARELMSRRLPGKVINIHSLLSHQGGIRVPAYTASKSGLLGLTRLMANELAPHGIQVNGIAPGYIATENTRALREDPLRNEAILDRIPAGRWGKASDLRGAAVFLASRASDYVTGSEVVVDGGWLAR
ncbi:MAG: SDR family oxidoreductase [Opitutales bacterium]|nr:SDR family oxidoreductase [Opitutales bacterium]